VGDALCEPRGSATHEGIWQNQPFDVVERRAAMKKLRASAFKSMPGTYDDTPKEIFDLRGIGPVE
jgi:hypothetical protein